jgi:hypothetical protein
MAQRFRAPHPDPRGHVHATLFREVDFVLIDVRTPTARSAASL